MKLIQEAFEELYPEKEFNFKVEVKYSNKFKDYNGNIRYYPMSRSLKFGLSKKWRSIDAEIRKGLIQELLIKTFGQRKKTKYIDYYNIFLKKVHLVAPKTEGDPLLAEAFARLNEEFFYNTMEQPNLVFKGNSMTQLGSYEYGSDTINISNILKDAPQEILDYVIYHEMLHKKHKFYTKNGKSFHHTSEFRKSEEKMCDIQEMERKLGGFLLSKRRQRKPVKKRFVQRLFDF